MTTPQERIRAAYGFDFPDEFFRFREFLRDLPTDLLADALDMRPASAFDLADGKPASEFPERPLWRDRYYKDLPEFVTIFVAPDGLHYGYVFDAPGELPPVVAHYWHGDSFDHEFDGDTLFEATRHIVESIESDVTDPDGQADEENDPGTLHQLALVRTALARVWGGDRSETGAGYLDAYGDRTSRKPVAPTYDGLGIVLPKKLYKKLSADPFVPDKKTHRVTLTRPQVDPLIGEALALLSAGKPGAALKLGRDLWLWAGEFPECYELLDAAYAELGRGPLRHMLGEARAWRGRCDAGRTTGG